MKIIRRKIRFELADNPLVHDCLTDIFLAEEIPKNIEKYITWENLDNFQYHSIFRHSIRETKKGRKLIWYYNSFDKITFKEWKKQLNLHLTVEYDETTISINELLKISDSEKVLQYLIEHGINFLKTP